MLLVRVALLLVAGSSLRAAAKNPLNTIDAASADEISIDAATGILRVNTNTSALTTGSTYTLNVTASDTGARRSC